jgi:hypothetical protein
MAGQTLTLTIASQLQKAGFTEAAEHMRKLQGEVEGVSQKSSALTEVVGQLKSAFTATAIIAFFKSAVDEAAAAEQSQLRLKTQVESTGQSWNVWGARINTFTAALAEVSRFADDDLNDALGTMIQRTGDVSVAMANLQTVMGISVATGRSVADVAGDIGAAANGNERAMKALAREFGVTGAAAQDAEQLLNILSGRFGKLATDTSTTDSQLQRLKNTFNEFKEQIGAFFLPVVNAVAAALRHLMEIIRAFAEGMASQLAIVTGVLTFNKNLIKEGLTGLEDAFARAFGMLSKPEETAKIEAGAKKTTAAVTAMSEELKRVVGDLALETEKIRAQGETNELLRLDRETEAFKTATLAKYEHEIKTAAQRNALLAAIDARAAAQRNEIIRKQYEEQFKAATTFGAAIGKVTGQMVAGERDAWKRITDIVIDSLVQQIQASIIAGQARAWITEVAGKGFLGLATGAALSGLVAGVGEVAKAAIRGGSGGGGASLPSGGVSVGSVGGGGAGDIAAAAPAAAARPSTTVHFHIQGDMVNDQGYIDRLINRVSEAVENRDVRLVATQVGG